MIVSSPHMCLRVAMCSLQHLSTTGAGASVGVDGASGPHKKVSSIVRYPRGLEA
jgi:hypothetical protein